LELQSNKTESCKIKFLIITANPILNFSNKRKILMGEKCKILLITTYWYTFQLAGWYISRMTKAQLAEQQFLLLALLAPVRKMTGFSAGTLPQHQAIKIYESSRPYSK
jgi:hypothetical protein